MGLDVSFNLNQAKEAGMTTEMVQNGTLQEAQQAAEEGEGFYAQWLMEQSIVAYIPGTEISVHASICEGNMCIRANQWGSVYAPLTKFLRDNNIVWDEF